MADLLICKVCSNGGNMLSLGYKAEKFESEDLNRISITGKPKKMPKIPEGSKLLCGYHQGFEELIILCDTLAEMQDLYDKYKKGGAINIFWYYGFLKKSHFFSE